MIVRADHRSPILRRLHRRCFVKAAPDPMWEAGTWWLAVQGEEPVAFAGVSRLYGDSWYLCRAGVLPVARGRGIQRQLIRVRERYARSQGARKMVTYTMADNVHSANNLIACGYRLHLPAPSRRIRDALHFQKRL